METAQLSQSYHDLIVVGAEGNIHGEEVKRLEQEREEEELRDVWVSCPIIAVDEPSPKRVCFLLINLGFFLLSSSLNILSSLIDLTLQLFFSYFSFSKGHGDLQACHLLLGYQAVHRERGSEGSREAKEE